MKSGNFWTRLIGTCGQWRAEKGRLGIFGLTWLTGSNFPMLQGELDIMNAQGTRKFLCYNE